MSTHAQISLVGLYLLLGIAWWGDELQTAINTWRRPGLFERGLLVKVRLVISCTLMVVLWPLNVVSRIWGDR